MVATYHSNLYCCVVVMSLSDREPVVTFCGSPYPVCLPPSGKTFCDLALPIRAQEMPLELVPGLALLLPAPRTLFILFLVPMIP